MPIMWCPADPEPDERKATQAPHEVDHHPVTTGHLIPADKGFTGQAVEHFLHDLGDANIRAPRTRSLIAHDH